MSDPGRWCWLCAPLGGCQWPAECFPDWAPPPEPEPVQEPLL